MPADRGTAATTDGDAGPVTRPDASMSMINDLLEERIEDDYLAASKQRSDSPHAARPKLPARIARRTAFFALVALCAVFATSGVQQLVTDAPQSSADHDALVDEAKDRSGNVSRLEKQLVVARAAYGEAQRQALAKSTEGADQVRELKRLQDVTGFNAVSGAGVVVTVDDATTDDLGEGAGGKILDRDLQVLVNGLWAAGATAISINGQRLTALTAIREAGDAVLVDYRPLARPYVVSAVGSPNGLQASFADGPAGRYFKTLQTSFDVRFEMEDRDRLRLAAASTVTLKYAQRGDAP